MKSKQIFMIKKYLRKISIKFLSMILFDSPLKNDDKSVCKSVYKCITKEKKKPRFKMIY